MGAVVRKTTVGAFEISTCDVGAGIETMVFNNVTGQTDVFPEFVRRHHMTDSAVRYHDEVVEKMRERFPDAEVAGVT